MCAVWVEAVYLPLEAQPQVMSWSGAGGDGGAPFVSDAIHKCNIAVTLLLHFSAIAQAIHELHETCHSVTFTVLVNSHQR